MSNKFRRFLESQFHRYYSLEVAKDFAIRATFFDSSLLLYQQDDPSVEKTIDEIYTHSRSKLLEYFPSAHKVSYNRACEEPLAIQLKCFASCQDDHIIYGLTVWVKNGKDWKCYNRSTHSWNIVDLVPYEGCCVPANECTNFEKIEDFYFVY